MPAAPAARVADFRKSRRSIAFLPSCYSASAYVIARSAATKQSRAAPVTLDRVAPLAMTKALKAQGRHEIVGRRCPLLERPAFGRRAHLTGEDLPPQDDRRVGFAEPFVVAIGDRTLAGL